MSTVEPVAARDLHAEMTRLGEDARAAVRQLAVVETEVKNNALRAAAAALRADHDKLLAANARDMDQAEAKGISGALLDRL